MLKSLLLLILFPVSLVAGTSADSSSKVSRIAFGISVGQYQRLLQAEVSGEGSPYYFIDGTNKGFGLSGNGYLRYYFREHAFVQAGAGYSYRTQNYYDSLSRDPIYYTDSVVNYSYTQYTVSSFKYQSANYNVGLAAGYEANVQRITVRVYAGLSWLRYTQQVFDFENHGTSAEQFDTLSNGNSYERYWISSYRNFIHGSKPWGIGVFVATELEYRVCRNFGIGCSAGFGGYLLGIKDGKWTNDYHGIETQSDTHGMSLTDEETAQLEYKQDIRRFDFSPVNAQLNFTWYFGN